MLFHPRSQDDFAASMNRCRFDAEQGRVCLALERADDLAADFPDDARPVYAQALLRRDFIGQGAQACALFDQAYRMTERIPPDAVTAGLASCSAAQLAPVCDAFRVWAEIALRELPGDDRDREGLRQELEALGRDPYGRFLVERSSGVEKGGKAGFAAAMLEVALATGDLSGNEEIEIRKHRAHLLREVDQQQQAHRNPDVTGERFAPAERLALIEAVAEMTRASEMDEYDPEIWNTLSAWCNLLERYDDALAHADRAASLRPDRYPKPWINHATALYGIDRQQEALNALEVAVRQAEEAGETADGERAREMQQAYAAPRPSASLEDLYPLMQQALRSARVAADLELGRQNAGPGNLETLATGVARRISTVAAGGAEACVPMLAELLSDFAPETIACVLSAIGQTDPRLRARCQAAICYIVVHGQGVQRRDAARAIALGLFAAGHDIGRVFLKAILHPSLQDGELSGLDGVIKAELGRFHPRLGDLVSDAAWALDPVTGKDSPLHKSPSAGGPGSASKGQGCLLALVYPVIRLLR